MHFAVEWLTCKVKLHLLLSMLHVAAESYSDEDLASLYCTQHTLAVQFLIFMMFHHPYTYRVVHLSTSLQPRTKHSYIFQLILKLHRCGRLTSAGQQIPTKANQLITGIHSFKLALMLKFTVPFSDFLSWVIFYICILHSEIFYHSLLIWESIQCLIGKVIFEHKNLQRSSQ